MYAANEDPLCYPGTTVLINSAGFREQSELDEYETAMMLTRWDEDWPDGDFSPSHYKKLHHHFFQDVYEWAGEYRKIRISKGSSMFCYPENIDVEMNRLFDTFHPDEIFHESSNAERSTAVARYLSDLNAIHPFREGNGRTQLAFLSMIAERAGFSFAPSANEAKRIKEALIECFSGSEARLASTLASVIKRA